MGSPGTHRRVTTLKIPRGGGGESVLKKTYFLTKCYTERDLFGECWMMRNYRAPVTSYQAKVHSVRPLTQAMSTKSTWWYHMKNLGQDFIWSRVYVNTTMTYDPPQHGRHDPKTFNSLWSSSTALICNSLLVRNVTDRQTVPAAIDIYAAVTKKYSPHITHK
jgi:hypothetical protein